MSVAKEWAGLTFLVALFLIIVSRRMDPVGDSLPLSVAILLPATVFGIAALFEYFSRTKA
jgi:hypothetical protein